MALTMKVECSVCCEEKKTMLTCASCKYDVCKTCIKTYLLGSTDEPHCMNCRIGWDRDIQYEKLGKSFINGEYRKHRKNILFNSEVAQLPATQYYVDACIEEEENAKNRKKVGVTYTENICLLHKLSDSSSEKMSLLEKEGDMMDETKRNALKSEYVDIQEEICKIKLVNASLKINHRKYTMKVQECRKIKGGTLKNTSINRNIKCPSDGCKGYVTSSKCSICNHHLCKKCYVLLDTEEELKAHECDKETYETAQMIIKSSKGCPSCGTRISKVSGCDQMWCPECDVAFSWKTGMKVTGVIHNPHFYQYQKIRGGANTRIIRNAGDRHCGGLVNTYDFVSKIRSLVRKMSTELDNPMSPKNRDSLNRNINDIYSSVGHFQAVLDKIRTELNQGINNINSRSKYMRDQITKEKFMTSIMRKYNRQEKNKSLQDIYELYVTVGTERMNNMYNLDIMNENHIFKKINETCYVMKQTRNYCNEQLKRISKDYNVVVDMFLDPIIYCSSDEFLTYKHRV